MLTERMGQGEADGFTCRVLCTRQLLSLEWTFSCLDCTDRLRKHCSHLVSASFLAKRVVLTLNGSKLPAKNADYCKFVNE